MYGTVYQQKKLVTVVASLINIRTTLLEERKDQDTRTLDTTSQPGGSGDNIIFLHAK